MCMCYDNACVCGNRGRRAGAKISGESKIRFFEKYRELVVMTFEVDSNRTGYKKLPASEALIEMARIELEYSKKTVSSDIYYLLGKVYKRYKENKKNAL